MKLLIVAALASLLIFLLITLPGVFGSMWASRIYPKGKTLTVDEGYRAICVGFYITIALELLIVGILYLIFGE